jgi:hypothetical protein
MVDIVKHWTLSTIVQWLNNGRHCSLCSCLCSMCLLRHCMLRSTRFSFFAKMTRKQSNSALSLTLKSNATLRSLTLLSPFESQRLIAVYEAQMSHQPSTDSSSRPRYLEQECRLAAGTVAPLLLSSLSWVHQTFQRPLHFP